MHVAFSCDAGNRDDIGSGGNNANDNKSDDNKDTDWNPSETLPKHNQNQLQMLNTMTVNMMMVVLVMQMMDGPAAISDASLPARPTPCPAPNCRTPRAPFWQDPNQTTPSTPSRPHCTWLSWRFVACNSCGSSLALFARSTPRP